MSSNISRQAVADRAHCGPDHKHPKFLLPCLHSLCSPCIEDLAATTEGPATVKCPDCPTRDQVPIDGLPLDYTVQCAQPKGKGLTCGLCSEPGALVTGHCAECDADLCDFCSGAHGRQIRTRAHEIASVNDGHVTGTKGRKDFVLCLKHPDQRLELFCETCATTLCQVCCSRNHRGHCCRFIGSDSSDRHLDRLRDTVDSVKPLVHRVLRDLDALSTASDTLRIQAEAARDGISDHIRQHLQAVEDHGKRLLTRVESIAEERRRGFQLQSDRLRKTSRDMDHALSFADRVLGHECRSKALSLMSPVTNRLLDIRAEYLSGVDILDRALRQPFVGFTRGNGCHLPVSGAVNGSAQPKAVVLRSRPDLRNVVIGMETVVVVMVTDADGQKVDGCLIAKEEISVRRQVPVKVLDLGDSKYSLSFRADRVGHYGLHITVQGMKVQGSPFAVTVRPVAEARRHSGTFHRCTFCFSGGSETSGVGGCGHGGLRGRSHWSCCGSVDRGSACSRPVSVAYQFTV